MSSISTSTSPSKCNSILKKLRLLDVFGVNLSISYLNKEKHGTQFGVTLTLLVYSLLIWKMFLSIKNLINREELESQYQEYPVKGDQIPLKDFEVALCRPYTLLKKSDKYDSLYKYSYSIQGEIPSPNKTAKNYIPKNKCVRKFLLNDHEVDANSFCDCLKFNEETYVNITKSTAMFQDKFLAVHIEADLSKIKEDGTLSSFDKGLLSTTGVIYPKNYVNTSDYFNLIQMDTMMLREVFIPGMETIVTLEADDVQVDVINDIYTFGLVNPVITSNYTYSLKVAERKNKVLTGSDQLSIVTVYFKHSGMQQLYSIYSFNLETFLALFGGYFQVFFVLFNILSSFVNNHSLEKKIERRFKKRIDRVNLIIDEINNKYLINPVAIDQNNISQDVPSVNGKINSPTHSVLQLGSPQLSRKNKTQNIELSSSNLSNLSNNLLKAKIQNYLPALSKEYYKDLTDDFLLQFDFEKLYKLIKEIKLIKFIIFDSDTLEWLNKLQEIPFCVEKFEEFIQSANYDKGDKSETFIDLGSKLHSIKEFLTLFKN